MPNHHSSAGKESARRDAQAKADFWYGQAEKQPNRRDHFEVVASQFQHIADTLSGDEPQEAQEPSREKLLSVFEAAFGLCHGYDWNNGTASRLYRRDLLSAVNAIREVPNFEEKYRTSSSLSRPQRGSE